MDFKATKNKQAYSITLETNGVIRVSKIKGDRTDNWIVDSELFPVRYSYSIEPYDGFGITEYAHIDDKITRNSSGRPQDGAFLIGGKETLPDTVDSFTRDEFYRTGSGLEFIEILKVVQKATEKPGFPKNVKDKIENFLDEHGIVAGAYRA